MDFFRIQKEIIKASIFTHADYVGGVGRAFGVLFRSITQQELSYRKQIVRQLHITNNNLV